MRILIILSFLFGLVCSSNLIAQDKKELKKLEEEIVEEKEKKEKKGLLSKFKKSDSEKKVKEGKEKKERKKNKQTEEAEGLEELDAMAVGDGVAPNSDAKIKKEQKIRKAAKLKSNKMEKETVKNYEKSLNNKRIAPYLDKYGRQINRTPRYRSDKKLQRINRNNYKRFKYGEKSRKPNRRRRSNRYN